MTTLGSLAIGSKIKISHSVLGDIIFLKADKDHDGYPSNSTTLITEKIILLRAFDAKEPNNSDSNRKRYGNNKYSVSNLDQWLNSSAAAGQWYSARHSADQAPNNDNVWSNYNEYDQDAGFLAGFDVAFVAALKDTTLKVALNTATDGGGYESVVRKFFLPSRAELFGAAENSIMEGSLLSYFSANTNDIRKAQISSYAAAHSEYSVTAGSNWYYWLRTPDSLNSCNVRIVYSGGSLYYYYACNGSVGVRPLCNLDSGISVSDSTDSDGCYTLNLGGGGSGIKSVDLTTLSGWAALAPGSHTIKIVAKGTGYRDSNPSTPVTVTKGSTVSYTNVTLDKVNASGQIQGSSYVRTGYTQISNADTSKYYLIRYLNVSSSYATAYIYWDSASAKWKVSNSQSYDFVSIVDSKSSSTKIVFCGVNSYEGAWYDWQNCQCLSTDVQPESATIPETVFTENGATVQSLAYYICIKEGTLITLADRTKKPIEDITYDDELLVWNFYKGKFDTAKPCWITKEQTAHEYNLCKFSNGAEVGFVGQGADIGYHRIYNDEAKAFTHTGVAETPIGTHTFDEYCNTPQLISQQVVTEPVKYYNVGTTKHINLFANGILTSSRISNKYAIEDMRYVGPQLISDEEEQLYILEKLKRS